MKIVIVESPKKCETISRYLGKDFVVLATQGHIRDLATSGKGGLGIDIENDFHPKYVITPSKKKLFYDISQQTQKADEVLLATDPDREGEAIAWHLADLLNLDVDATKRLEFHEITRVSIESAIKSPRKLDMNLVASQETRRILDRIIGFKLSALMQKKLKSRSAGRVQSATLKLICDHEKEILAFVPVEYWDIIAQISLSDKKYDLKLERVDGKAADIHDGKSAHEVLARLGQILLVDSIKKSTRSTPSKPPFTTSTLQQEAFNHFRFPTKKTVSLAQRLYEGIELGDEHVGLITYTRTDSTRLSDTFVNRANTFISETFGPQYVGHVKKEKLSLLGQDAHEAIRPTFNHRTPESVAPYLSPELLKLYRLIYNRALGSLMPDKKEEITIVTLRSGGLEFKIEGSEVLFDGFTHIYGDIDSERRDRLPSFEKGSQIGIETKSEQQGFTKPPARYSEAKVVQIMEEAGIGRPSTYASTITLLKDRDYVTSKSGIITPTAQGMKTAHVIAKYFPDLVDVGYTAKMESDLDHIQYGNVSRSSFLNNFYYPFDAKVKQAYEIMYKEPEEETGEMCPRCGSPLIKKHGKHGDFVACSSYPTCDYVKKEERVKLEATGEMCPRCGLPLVVRKDKKGRPFVACSGYPKCTFIKDRPSAEMHENVHAEGKCPRCGGELIVRKGKHGDFVGCANFPKCHYRAKIETK